MRLLPKALIGVLRQVIDFPVSTGTHMTAQALLFTDLRSATAD